MDDLLIQNLIEMAKKEDIQKIVVGAIITRNERILLLERPNEEFMGGIYELPSGNLEAGEGLLEGLKREVKEETNLDMKNAIAFIDHFDYTSKSGKKVRQFNFYISTSGEDIRLREHKSYTWALPSEKEYGLTTDSVKKSIKKFYSHLRREGK